MTMDTYGHLIPDVHDQAINVLEEIASSKINESYCEKLVKIG